MKHSEIAVAIQDDPELKRFVVRANELLDLELGPSGDRVSASWRLLRDEGDRRIITLELSDGEVKTYDVFTPDDLKKDSHAGLEMVRVWGKLLKGRSHKLREELLSADREAGRV